VILPWPETTGASACGVLGVPNADAPKVDAPKREEGLEEGGGGRFDMGLRKSGG
jgi:hypothetical protein